MLLAILFTRSYFDYNDVLHNFSFVASTKNMKLTEQRVAKVVPHRIFSVAVHPTESRVLACAGDKWGRLGIWDVVRIDHVPMKSNKHEMVTSLTLQLCWVQYSRK